MRPDAVWTRSPGAIGILLNDFQLGGCERVAIRLANTWRAMGVRVILYVADDRGSLRSLVAGGVEVRRADPPIGPGALQALRLGWWAGRRMAHDGVTRCFLPGNSQFDGALPVRLATRGRVAVYAKISNPLWRPDRGLPGNMLFGAFTRLRLAGVAGIAALSPRLLHDDEKVLGSGRRGRVLPDALGSRWPATAGVRPRPFHLCAVGRLAPQKNFALALRSIALLQDLPVRLTLVGDGPQMPALRQLAQQLGIADRVQFTGAVDDILVSPLLGRVVEPVTPEAFAAAIRAFLTGAQRWRRDARRELARSLFARHLDEASAREYLDFMRLHPSPDDCRTPSRLTAA